jgi:serine/threonine-protein kinase
MSSDDRPLSEEEYQLLLAACDEALAAGTPFTSVCATVAAPELRPRLEQEIAWCQLVRQLLPRAAASSFASTVEVASPPVARTPEPTETHLGRFAIRRELGRGSFGVVFLAYDPRLHREVALKVPRPEALVTPELRARFRHEGQAAASLDHPNLVPIYEAGEEGSVCYLASAYCAGTSLDRWLRQRTEPVPYRLAAELMATLADAVEHAHKHGVIHRDLKPSNILLAADGRRETQIREEREKPGPGICVDLRASAARITDFGLAKLLDSEAGPSSAGWQTHSGAILGTPQYMAPEQGGGQSKLVGPAADVYALGAILYELLTSRPPFQAGTVLDTLLLLRTQEPLSPARLRPKLPRDLETICLKCLRKAPHQRYASARALADDLRRYLAGKPIQARPTPLWEQGAKWARRRPALAVSLGLVAAAVLAGVVGVVLFNVRLQHERSAAEESRQDAEANFRMARDAVDQMLTRVGFERLADMPHLEAVRRDLLEDACRFYEGFVRNKSSSPSVRQEMGQAYRRLGKIREELGRYAEAEQAFRTALEINCLLASESPAAGRQARGEVARCHNNLGLALWALQRLPEAEAELRQAAQLQEQLAAEVPDEPGYRQDLAVTYTKALGVLLHATGRTQEAEQLFRRGLRLQDQLVADFPAERAYGGERASTHLNLGTLLAKAKRLAEAESHFRAHLAFCREHALGPSAGPASERALARGYYNLAGVLAATGRLSEAEQTYRQALAIREKAVRSFPAIPLYRQELAASLQILADFLVQNGSNLTEARQLAELAVSYRQALLQAHPQDPNNRRGLREVYSLHAETLVRLGEHAAAAQTALQLPLLYPDSWQERLSAGWFLARCVPLADKDESLSASQRDTARQNYADRAVQLLREAVQRGYKDLAYLQKDPNLQPLRSRKDFQRLLADVEAKVRPANP